MSNQGYDEEEYDDDYYSPTDWDRDPDESDEDYGDSYRNWSYDSYRNWSC